MAKWEDVPSKWEDVPNVTREASQERAESGIKETGKLLSNLATAGGAALFGVGAGIRDLSIDTGLEAMKAFQEAAHIPYKNPKGSFAKGEENVIEGLDWLTQRMGDAGVLSKQLLSDITPGHLGKLIGAVPEEMARFGGEVGGQFLPFPPVAKGLGAIERGIKGRFNSSGILSAEEIAARDAALGQPTPNTFPTLNEQPPKAEPYIAHPTQTPFPVLDEKALTLPNEVLMQPRPEFPVLEEAPVRPTEYKGIKLEEPSVPEEAPLRPLEITPDDRPIPHVPNRQFENVMEPSPESRLIDALLSKDIETQRIRDMEANTRTTELRGQMDSIDFPLRQEVLEQPAIKEAIDNFRREAERLKDMPEQLAKLQEEFAAGMKQLGIDKASDAYGRALYEAGQGTKLPIEKQIQGVNKVARDAGGWSDFTRASMPPEPLGNRGKGGRFVPKSQRGVIHPDLLTYGVGTLLKKLGKLKTLEMFRGTFNGRQIDQLRRVSERPLSRETYVFMSPDKFLELAKTRPTSLLEYAPARHKEISKALKTNSGLDDIPYLYTENGKVTGHEGRHRMDVLKEQGLDLVPVRIIDSIIRWGERGITPDINSLISENIPLGQTAKGSSQRGGRKDPLANNPEFIRFKNALPENFKGRAKKLWNSLEEEKRQKAVVETTPGKTSEDAIASITGLHKIVEDVAPIHERSVEEMLPIITSSPDTKMGMLARSWRTGAQLTGFEKKNVLIRYVGDIVNNAVRSYEVKAKNVLKDKEAGVITKIEALPMKERTQVREAMRAMEGKEGTIDTSLWTDKQKEAYTAYRKAMDDGFTYMNEVRALLGLKPLKYRPNYLPSRWDGDFLIPVYDKDNVMVHAITTGTKMGAKNALKKMRELHPEYNFGEIEYRSITQHSKDLEASQRSVMQMLANDDPALESIQRVFEELLAAQTYGTQNFKKHFEAKRKEGMGGFEGGKEWLSPEQNAKEGFQSDMRYLEQLYKWGELQKAGQKINKLLSNPEVLRTQKNAVKFAKNYWEGVSGHGTKTAKVLDGVLDLFGEYSTLGAGNVRDIGKTLKTLMTLHFLGLGNIAYMGSQAWQPLQMAPAWMYYLEQKGAKANKAISEVKADLDSVAPMEMKSQFGKEASKWAHDNHIADSYILDEITDAGSAKMARSLEDMAQYITPAKIEIFSRYNAFMRYAHFLNDSGVPKMQALEAAAKITDMSMTNYHMHERPMIYRNLGFVGDMASSFTTFKHNQWQQLNAFGRNPKQWKALTALIGMQLVSGGLMGLYARDEIDTIIKKINSSGLFEDYIPTTRETLLRKDWADLAVFGGVSAVTGMDMSSKFSAADVIPNGLTEAFLPFANSWAKMADGLSEMVSRRSDESVRQFAHSVAPTSLKWTLEDPVVFGEKHGSTTIDPQSDKGLAKRTPFDRAARMMGAYSINEARQRFAVMEEKNQTKWQADRSASILQKAKDADGADISDLARQYEKLGGSTREIQEALQGHKLDQFMSAFEREKGKNPTSTKQLLKAKRMQGYER